MKRTIVISCIFIALSVQCIAQIPTNGLAAWYPFTGNANDASGNNNNGTISGATFVNDRFGNVNKAMSFDGVNDVITIPNSSSLNITGNISISFWMKPGTNTVAIPISKRNSTDEEMHYVILMDNTRGITFQFSGLNAPHPHYEVAKPTVNVNSLLTDGNWHFVVFKHQYGVTASTIIYIDNQLYQTEYTGSWTQFNYPAVPSNSLLKIGCQISQNWYKGILDDIRIYNRSIDSSEIQQLYTENGWGLPAVTTNAATNILENLAVLGGNVISAGSSAVTTRGICWNTQPNPTVTNNFTTNGSGTGTFSSTLTGLAPVTQYYARAYATNSYGTAYGNEVIFTTLGSLNPPCPGVPTVAYSGKTYNTILIGQQCWLKENLNIGTKINGTSNQTNNTIIEKYCYNNDTNMCNTYGGLYQWNEVMQYSNTSGGQGLCPYGWHIPEEFDYLNLASLLGGFESAGGKMKETGTNHWAQPNSGADNTSGFTALPGGYRDVFGNFSGQGYNSFFWTGNSSCNVSGINFQMAHNRSALHNDYHGFSNAFSVRCIYDSCIGITTASLQIESSDTIICSGTEVTFTAHPASGGYSPTFQWFVNGVLQSEATSLSYTFEPANQDAIWCQMVSNASCVVHPVVLSDTIIIYQSPSISCTWSDIDPLCPGSCDGLISIQVTGGAPPFQYTWSNGDTTQTIDSLCSGVYYLTVSDANLCSFSDEVELSSPNSVNWIASLTDATCVGVCDGTISLANFSGGAPPYHLTWNTGDTTNELPGLCAGTYSVTVTDANECQRYENYTLVANLPVYVSIQIYASDNPFCPGTMVQFYAEPANGGVNPQFQWQVNGQDYEGANQPVFSYFPAGGDVVRCKLNSGEPCTHVNPVFSNEIIMESYTVIMNPIGNISGPSVFCKDMPYPTVMWEYSIDPIPGVVNYYWIITRNGIVEESYTTQEPRILRATPTSTYLLTVSNLYYCGVPSLYSSELLVNVVEIIPIIEGPDTVTMNDICTYTTQPGMINYQWSASSGGQMIGGGGNVDNFCTIQWNTSGYQTVSVSYSDTNGCTATQPTTDSILVNLPSVASSNIGGTRFDIQTNASGQNRIYLFSDGTLGATYMLGYQETTFPDRGTGYNYFNGIEWNLPPTARIENKRTGWPSYSPLGAEGELVVTHTSDSPTKLMLAKRTTKGTGSWTFSELAGPSPTIGLVYPRAVTNGTDHTQIHLLALTTPGTYGGYVVYNRSLDGGLTWSGWQIIPGLDSAQYSGFSADAFSFAQPKGDTLCFTSGTNWCDQVLMKSTDNGSTWTKTIIWPSLYNHVTSQAPVDTFYCADKSNAVTLDHEGMAHVVFGRNKIKSNGANSSTALSDGLIYWNENMPQLPQSLDSALLVAGGNWLANIPDPSILATPSTIPNYGLSLTSMPSMVTDGDFIYVAWTSVTPAQAVNGKKLRHVFAKASNNRGLTWCSNTIDLCNIPEFSLRECVYPGFAPQTGANELYLIFQHDSLAGCKVNNSGQTVYDNNNLHLLSIPKASFSFSDPPSQPGSVSGPPSPCVGSEQIYTVPGQPGVNYHWTFPSGWIQSSGGISDTVTVWVGATPGVIHVVPSNECGSGPARTLTVIPADIPGPAGPISGPSLFCDGLHTMEMKEYSISPVPGATSYEWFIDGVLSPYSNSNIILLPFPQHSYQLSVQGVNSCGNGLSSSLQITLITVVPIIQGANSVCAESTESYFTEPGMSSYQWTLSAGGNIISGGGPLDNFVVITWTTPGNHSLTVNYKEAHGCTAMYPTSYQVNVHPQISISPMVVIHEPSCFGGCDGSITDIEFFEGTPPFTYLWNNGMTTLPVSGLCTGVYTLTVTDNFGCQDSQSFFVGEPTQIEILGFPADATCAFACDGSISTMTGGGTAPYTYLWSNGATTAGIEDLCEGTYSLTVTDISGCEGYGYWIIGVPLPLILNSMVTELVCNGSCEGEISLQVSGGVPPYTYVWNDGSTSPDRAGLCAGSYSVTVSDYNACQIYNSFFITNPDEITASATPVSPSCEGVCDGMISIDGVSGGAPPYSYLWNTGSTSSSISGLCSGAYSITITDSHYCQKTDVFSLFAAQAAPVSVSINVSANPVSTGTLVTCTATPVNGGTDPFYQWFVNGLNLGANSPTFLYYPAVNDQVQCVLTSNQACVSDNPAYSNIITMEITFPSCPEELTVNYGGLTYHTVLIGTQCWFRENLNIGTKVTGNSDQLNNSIIEKYCYNNLESNCDIFGGLYQWNEAMQFSSLQGAQGICPAGWHIPTEAEWNILIGNLGGNSIAGGKLKETGLSHWLSPNQYASNSSGFTGLPGGSRVNGLFYYLSQYGYLWSSDTNDVLTAKRTSLRWNDAIANQYYHNKVNGYSVRCMKDGPVSTNQTIQNQVLQNGQTHCFNATQTITVAGNGSYFVIMPGSSATLIAGQNILFYPGTSVQSNGYLHGYISPGGPWCTTPAMPAVMESTPESSLPDSWAFRLYPNPTTASFTVELREDPDGIPVQVEIFNVMGDVVLKDQFSTGRAHQYSLGDRTSGIYFVRISQNGVTGTGKIIRQ